MSEQQDLPAWPTRFWHPLDSERIECDLCPHHCQLKAGQRGLCFVRANQDGRLALTTYGRSSGFCIDPIEKKPLNHFLPGTPVLSFGTAGCNLSCKFCQNWDISKARAMDVLMDSASPEQLAQTAKAAGCRSLAYTYNDPVIFHEYAIDTAQACRALGIKSVAVTAGYVEPEPRAEFFRWMDAANVDLKGFSEAFYRRLCGGHLAPVLDCLSYIRQETQAWLEVTCLLIPGENDNPAELDAMTQWLVEHLGPNTPLHFSAFHPDWRLNDRPPTDLASLQQARRIALDNGLAHVYLGNVRAPEAQSSLCSFCGQVLIGRDRYSISDWRLDARGCCTGCGQALAGVFEAQPGHWGSRFQRIQLNRPV
jgi:pyruvate formate lyase activating enzyme